MMDVGTICSRDVVTCRADDDLRHVSELMRMRHVGAVVVLAANGVSRKVAGVVTDRDIVIEVVATGLDARAITAGDIAGKVPVTAREHDSLLDAIHRMRSRGVRRLPVLDIHGELKGIVTLDDLLHALTHELSMLVRVADHQPAQEARARH